MEEQVETSGQKVLEKAKWKDLRSKQTNQQKLKKKTGLLSIKFEFTKDLKTRIM